MEGKIDPEKMKAKFGDEYIADRILYIMGIDIRFSERIASRLSGRTVLETCTGGGFSTIALARFARHVVTVDIDPYHHKAAMGNVEKAGLSEKVTFIQGDALDPDLIENAVREGVLPSSMAREGSGSATAGNAGIDAAFLDPDWAVSGPDHVYRFRGSNTRPPADKLLERVLDITSNIALILPPFIDLAELEGIPSHELQRFYMDDKIELFVLYFGDLIEIEGETEVRISR